ncbi:MAG TPA: T9SS type A sorting domain-containing protein [Caldithrix abyssi]|uniref:T9SS type A sorting domain-containing protein n=1 Tax=Caldithrix abyssi TaxID=187145 RepID=A0A7V4WVW2_CALAY|nr:T9SS type A sorting domain-containing protein [Caldithrix abyssi]
MKRISFALFLGLAVYITLLPAQNEDIFPGLTGSVLLDSLRYHYKPVQVLDYDTARDTMFAVIDNHNDSVTCVYSGYRIWLDPQNDPSSDAYAKDMNTEHTWPQSMGADQGNAKSDLHHLFPCRAQVNSSRGNAPYADISDPATDTWWRLNYSQSNIPTSYIDEYSEKDNDGDYFEPREDHKGNAARAVFYFYTMYKDQADSAFFETQKETLRRWHYQDPADNAEFARNDRVAVYQDGKKNPFILDSTLVRRAYFSGDSSGGSGSEAQPGDIVITEIMQNPAAVYDSDGEWFEIYNNSAQAIDLNGWYIKDDDTDQHQINNGGSLLIQPGAYMVLGINGDSLTNGGVGVDYVYSGFTLANGADEVVLCLSDNTTEIDRVTYDGGTVWPDPTGASMYYSGTFTGDNNDGTAWATSQNAWAGSAGDEGTPGAPNSVSALSWENAALPQHFQLGNFPNPFNPTTTIVYQLPAAAHVDLKIYDIRGRQLVTLVNETQQPGKYSLVWNGSDSLGRPLSSGIYFLRIAAAEWVRVKKITLLR